MVTTLIERIKKDEIDIDSVIDVFGPEDDEAEKSLKRNAAKQSLARVNRVKRQILTTDQKLQSTPKRNVHVRRRLQWKYQRSVIKLSRAIQHVPFPQNYWNEFSDGLYSAEASLSPLYAERERLKAKSSRKSVANGASQREIRREIRKAETALGIGFRGDSAYNPANFQWFLRGRACQKIASGSEPAAGGVGGEEIRQPWPAFVGLDSGR